LEARKIIAFVLEEMLAANINDSFVEEVTVPPLPSVSLSPPKVLAEF
jgi:hypothetical protein